MTNGGSDSIREDLRDLASALRTYLEWHEDTGTSGLPRDPNASRTRPRTEAPRTTEPETTVPKAAPEAKKAPARKAEDFPPLDLSEPSDKPATTRVASTRVSHTMPAPGQAPKGTPEVRLPVMQSEVASCTRCGLSEKRTNAVFARGNPKAKLCVVGEAPGADEDAQGLPFVGKAGQLLDKMISAMGLDPEADIYVCNVIKCRPPGNRKPTPEENEACMPYLVEQLELVQPHVILAMGNTAVSALLGTSIGITKLRGQWKLYRGTTLLMPTFHPSYLLREGPTQKEAKKQAWSDLQAVMKELGLEAKA